MLVEFQNLDSATEKVRSPKVLPDTTFLVFARTANHQSSCDAEIEINVSCFVAVTFQLFCFVGPILTTVPGSYCICAKSPSIDACTQLLWRGVASGDILYEKSAGLSNDCSPSVSTPSSEIRSLPRSVFFPRELFQ